MLVALGLGLVWFRLGLDGGPVLIGFELICLFGCLFWGVMFVAVVDYLGCAFMLFIGLRLIVLLVCVYSLGLGLEPGRCVICLLLCGLLFV